MICDCGSNLIAEHKLSVYSQHGSKLESTKMVCNLCADDFEVIRKNNEQYFKDCKEGKIDILGNAI